MRNLINDSGHTCSPWSRFLDMSKMESGNLEISPEPFAPRGALLNAQPAGPEGEENGIDLVTRAGEDLPVITAIPARSSRSF